MTPAQQRLRDSSQIFNELVKNARIYGGEKQPFDEKAHAAQVLKNLTEEINEFLTEKEKKPYSVAYWCELADALFCAYTFLSLPNCDLEITKEISEFLDAVKNNTVRLPYMYAAATAASNLSKFFDITKISGRIKRENNIYTFSWADKENKPKTAQVWETEIDKKTLYFLSINGKVSKHFNFGYRSKEAILVSVNSKLAEHHKQTAKGEITEFSHFKSGLEVIDTIIDFKPLK